MDIMTYPYIEYIVYSKRSHYISGVPTPQYIFECRFDSWVWSERRPGVWFYIDCSGELDDSFSGKRQAKAVWGGDGFLTNFITINGDTYKSSSYLPGTVGPRTSCHIGEFPLVLARYYPNGQELGSIVEVMERTQMVCDL